MIRADTAKVVSVARSQLGYAERPVNRTKFGQWFGLDGQAWCAMFVSWVFAQAGFPLPRMQTSKGFALVAAGRDWARRNGVWRSRASGYRPKPGDIVIYSIGGSRPDHTGIHVRMDGSRFVAVEGNTNGIGSRTGGSVLEKARSASQILGWIEVAAVQTQAKPEAKPQPEPEPQQEDDPMAIVISHHNGQVWLHASAGRSHLKSQADVDYWIRMTGRALLDLRADPAASQRWLDASPDVAHVGQTALRAVWLQTIVARIAAKLGVPT